MSDSSKAPYSEAVSTGTYAKKSGLTGKYDNVRRFWEDEVTRLFIRKYLKDMVERKTERLQRFRVLDLGCGSGDGFDLLTGITAKDVGIYEYAVSLLSKDMLGFYKGIDINDDLIAQAVEHCGNPDKVVFERMDISGGLNIDDAPYDVYFTSYGTMSHFRNEQMVKLLSDIAVHSEKNALIVLDWLGRYSYEWQDLWTDDRSREQFMDYRISYIYPPEERDSVDIQSFPLKLTDQEEVSGIIERASETSGAHLDVKTFFVRSVFVGRHMDTAEYNRHCPPVREAVNSLLEPNCRTDLNRLFVDYVPRSGFDRVNRFFDLFSMCWNSLIKHTISFLSEYSNNGDFGKESGNLYSFYPEPLRQAILTMRRVIDSAADLPGDSRANIIEPQLAYALRKLEMELQSDTGTGHGLGAIMEVNK